MFFIVSSTILRTYNVKFDHFLLLAFSIVKYELFTICLDSGLSQEAVGCSCHLLQAPVAAQRRDGVPLYHHVAVGEEFYSLKYAQVTSNSQSSATYRLATHR